MRTGDSVHRSTRKNEECLRKTNETACKIFRRRSRILTSLPLIKKDWPKKLRVSTESKGIYRQRRTNMSKSLKANVLANVLSNVR